MQVKQAKRLCRSGPRFSEHESKDYTSVNSVARGQSRLKAYIWQDFASISLEAHLGFEESVEDNILERYVG